MRSISSNDTTLYLFLVLLALVVVFEFSVVSRSRVHITIPHLGRHGSNDSYGDVEASLQATSDAVLLLEAHAEEVRSRLGLLSTDEIVTRVFNDTASILNDTTWSVHRIIDRAKEELKQSAESFKGDLQSAIAQRKSFPVDSIRSFPSGDAAHGAPLDAAQRQQIISQIENETPSEPVDEVPGPHYVAPPDPWQELPAREKNRRRADAVKNAFLHSWRGYATYAYGWDELQPRSRSGKNWNEQEGTENGLALTILDSITTMFVMKLDDELKEALRFIKTKLSFQRDVEGSTFESTIRMLGSLLSIYELTGESDQQLLSMAVDVASRIMWAYNTSSGLPHSTVGFSSHRHFNQQWIGGSAVLSEFGTAQLEMRTLSYHTQDPTFDMKVTHVMDIIEAKCPRDMLCPCYMNMRTTQWTTDHVSLGALGDSYYEYVLKQYLLTGKKEERYRRNFVELVRGIIDKLLYRSYPSGWAYVAEFRRGEYYHKMDHLACFVGGMLALGAVEVDDFHREQLLQLAGELTETCVKMYTRQKSGVSPEYVEFPAQQDFINGPGYYILRPETMESLFYMWRFTKEQKWRDYGWQIFRAIDRWCRVDTGGYSGLKEVNVHQPIKDNLMQSFWMAETLKYSYLLFADDDALDLKEWVFNTEAHPLRRRSRDPMDVWRVYESTHNGEAPWYAPDIPGVTPTQTARMEEHRKKSSSHVVAPVDSFGEDAMDGPVDDEGQPYDPVRGFGGLPKHAGSGLSSQYIIH